MDVTLLVSFALILVVVIFILTVLTRRKASNFKDHAEVREPVPRGQQIRRAAGTRNARRRMHVDQDVQVAGTAVDRSDEENNDEVEAKKELTEGKIGAKKRAKLEAKAEKKIQREATEREREERKKREQLLQEERDRQNKKEREEERRKEEAEIKAREEKERREHEEYLRMKEAFSVEEEGCEEPGTGENENLMQEFLKYIKQNKVVVLEDLSAHFKMKTVNVIDRIQNLQEDGNLTGVIDDRGKFIYISQEELEAVAKFVRQRGRVSIVELAENSNRLINLNPGNNYNTIETQ